MRDVCADSHAEPAEFNGEPGHAHLLMNLPPTVAISRLVNSPKGVSSRRLRQEFPELRQHYWRARHLWARSYLRDRLAEHPSLSRASTPSSRTAPPDRLMPGHLHHRPEDRHTGGQIGSTRRQAQTRP